MVDFDDVDISNLQRQIIHFTADIGRPKVESAREKMQALNPDVNVKTYKTRLQASNIREIIGDYDFVIDGVDNFPTKFLINDACVMEGIPFSHGGILRFEGQTMTVIPGKTACYRCVFKEPPPPNLVPTCSQAGVLGAIAGMLGTIQAAEALKFFTETGELLTDRMLIFDAKKMRFRETKFKRNIKCAVCSEHPTITEPVDYEQAACDMKEDRKQASNNKDNVIRVKTLKNS